MKRKYLDLLERTVWTFVEVAGAFLLLHLTDVVDIGWRDVLYGALTAGGIAVVKCLIAFRAGNPQSAAMPETTPPV
jgi:hypothetical protein